MNAVLLPTPQPTSIYRPMQLEDVGRVVEIERQIYQFPWSPGNFTDSLHAGYNCWINQQAQR